jgi:hypothetical protein
MLTSDEAAKRIERPLSVINVPSKGKYYDKGKSEFLIRHLSYIEESVLANEGLMETEEGIKLVLRSLMIDDFDVDMLMPGDVQAISMFLYSTAYGDKISIDVICPTCSLAEKKDVRISDFKMKEVDIWPNEQRRLEGRLPVSGWEFVLRVPTFFEEFKFKKSKENGRSHLEKIAFLMKSLNGESDEEKVFDMVMSMPIRDSRFLRSFIEKNTPGVDTKMDHECTNCHQTYGVHVSTGHNFLQLPESYAASMLEEVYLVAKHGESIGWEAATKMSTSQRKWVLLRIQKDNKARNDEDSKQASKLKSRTRRFKQ